MIKHKNKIKVLVATLGVVFLTAGCNPFAQSSGATIVKTTNGGVDWQTSNASQDQATGSLSSVSVSQLHFDPQNSEHVFVSSYNSGLYKSEDSGASWRRILSKINVYDFVIDATDSNLIYAGGFFSNHGKALVSKDGGKSWLEIYNEESTQNAVRAIAVNTQNHNEIVLGMSSGNIIKSTDGGNTWRLMINFDNRVNRLLWDSSGMYVLLKDKGLYKSGDGGQNFDLLTTQLSGNFGSGTFISSQPVSSFSQFAISPKNPQLILVTTDVGLYKTTNAGQAWQLLPVPIKTKEVAGRAVVIAPSSDSTIYSSAGATIYKTTDGGQTFQTQSVKTSGFINAILVHPDLPQVVYAGAFIN